MAHEIDQTTGRAAVFVTGEPAWHRLGTVIERATTSAEAIGLAGLDWRVEQWPVRAFDPDHNSTEAGIPDVVANVRTDTKAVLGVVGKRYRVFQNREAFDFMDALVGDKLAMYETAGSLHGGRRVWMLAAIPKEYRAGSDDLIKPYVLLTNTHDGSQALRMIPTTVRVVCQNTLNLALGLSGAEGLTISHHPRLETRIAEARTKLGIIAARFDRFDEELHAMLAKDLSVTEASGYFRGLSGMDNLTRDPELKTLPSQTVVCDFGLAVNRRWKDPNGADRQEVLFVDCAAFGKTGQTIGESLTKGRPIHVEGRLRLEQWEQEDGQRRSKIRVVVEQFRFVDRKPDSGPPGERSARGKRRSTGKTSRPARQPEAEPVGAGADKDIPF